ncbi:hypothetical protein SAMN04490187_1911 [Pseudomonas jessenii]|uniref:Uncharacterized protein n=2 Tax=Pseudomonas TaxID=286 RepID=A0A1H4M2U6_PSEJE|nr:hypothetical protein SAMN04490187_1911 [Pseudomonas jessenii]VVQ07978.1 hypothetical protein PS922_04387 [Pseudomonas fluorescens]
MRSINPFEIWLFPLRDSQSCNPLPHYLSILGGGQ